jgi:DNA-binding FadR family transcriptional regulator
MAASFQEHDTIVQAIQKSDEDLANKQMKIHVTVQGERFSDLLAALEKKDA